MPTLPLFSYGTLRDPEYQRELFGRSFPMQAARVLGFAAHTTDTGYLAAAARDGMAIDGMLVALDDAAYLVADDWEDMSVYDRTTVDARVVNGSLEQCCMYVARNVGGIVVMDARLAEVPRATVISDIRRFRAGRPLCAGER